MQIRNHSTTETHNNESRCEFGDSRRMDENIILTSDGDVVLRWIAIGLELELQVSFFSTSLQVSKAKVLGPPSCTREGCRAIDAADPVIKATMKGRIFSQ